MSKGGPSLLIKYLASVELKIASYFEKLSDPVSFLYSLSRTTTRFFLDNYKHKKYL